MWLAIAILLNDEIHNYMRKVQLQLLNEHDHEGGVRLEAGRTPHVTIKQPFEAVSLERAEDYFDRLASEIEPFEIVVRGIGFFEGGVVFLDVGQDPRLVTLQRRVLADLADRFGTRPAEFEDDRYQFHATLAFISEDAFERVRAALRDVRTEFRFVFDTLGLFYRTDEGWVLYKRARVGI